MPHNAYGLFDGWTYTTDTKIPNEQRFSSKFEGTREKGTVLMEYEEAKNVLAHFKMHSGNYKPEDYTIEKFDDIEDFCILSYINIILPKKDKPEPITINNPLYKI